MTEAEWLAAEYPDVILEFLISKVSDRELRLFACACCRLVLQLLEDSQAEDVVLGRWLVLLAEELADGKAESGKLHAVLAKLQPNDPTLRPTGAAIVFALWATPSHPPFIKLGLFSLASAVAWDVVPGALSDEDDWDLPHDPAWRKVYASERAKQVMCLKDVVLNPFKPTSMDPSQLLWNFGTITKLAQSIYDDRRFADLPILADALEEAGCTDAAILEHCRGGGDHVHGCWAVDLLTGRR